MLLIHIVVERNQQRLVQMLVVLLKHILGVFELTDHVLVELNIVLFLVKIHHE